MNTSEEQQSYLEGLGGGVTEARATQEPTPAASGSGAHKLQFAGRSSFLAAGNAVHKDEVVKRPWQDLNPPDAKPNEIIIRGITTSGRIFRPSDWAERLAGILSTFEEDNRLGYSPSVRPTVVDGIKSVIVSKHLKEIDERAYHFLLSFARENDLVIADGDKAST